ncbi:MAG: hypothetical protein NWE83_09705 [Candidatus Bathyarchaeota archaeon]|nr:hypothetical protein [Candidatus Bathyarchaeota archaeon]
MPQQPKRSPNDILLYVYEHNHVRAKDLERVFVTTRQMSRATMYKYKRVLEAQGKLERHAILDHPPYYVYAISERFHPEMRLLQQYRAFANNTFLNIEKIPWQNPPDGMYLTNVQHKVLWKDQVTGALMVLSKAPEGIPEPVHIHPHANEWGFGLAGELETVEGRRIVMQNTFSFVRKGERSGVCRVTKELLILLYWDGPPTKVTAPEANNPCT